MPQLRQLHGVQLGKAYFQGLFKGNPGFLWESAWLLLWRALGSLFTFVFTLVISRNYGASELGVYSIFVSSIAFIAIFSRLGLELFTLRELPFLIRTGALGKARGLYAKSLLASFLVSLAFTLGLVLFAVPISHWLFKGSLDPAHVVFLGLASLPLGLSMYQREVIRALGKTQLYMLINAVVNPLFCLLAAGVLLFFSKNLFSHPSVILYVGGVLVAYFLGLFYLLFWAPFRKVPQESYTNIVPVMRQSFSHFLPGILSVALAWSLVLAVNYFHGESETGMYFAALKMASLITLLPSVLPILMNHRLSEAFKLGQEQEIQKILNFASRMYALVVFLVAPLALWITPYVIGLFGKEFLAMEGAGKLIILGELFVILFTSVGNVLQMSGNQKIYTRIVLLGLLVQLLLLVVLTPVYGVLGAAIIRAGINAAIAVAGYIWVRRNLGLDAFFLFRKAKSALRA